MVFDSHSQVKSYEFSFAFDHVPPIMLRGRHALLVLKDAEGKYILGVKYIYPEGIVRFIGGGIEVGEDPHLGAARELQEELGIVLDPKALRHIATIVAKIKNSPTFTTYLYFVDIGNTPLSPADDISGIKRLNDQEMHTLIKRFGTLSSELLDHPEDKLPFRWSDYGKLYGSIHQIGFDLTKDL